MERWQQFFDVYASKYDQEVFTKNTAAEVPFICEHLQLRDGARILDIGCGTGRHSVGLAARGLNVTGLDVSPEMLRLAAQRAGDAGVSVAWVQSDATALSRHDEFDAAICLCEGAMCLLGAADDALEHDMTILRNIHAALRPGGRFMLNVLNACRMIRNASDESVAAGHFDIVTLTEASDVASLLPDSGAAARLRERGYTAPEIHRMLIAAGFAVDGIYGGTAGDWALRPPKLDEYELMIFATKP